MNQQMTAAQRREYAEWMETSKRILSGVKPILNESPGKKAKRIKHLLNPKNFEDFIDHYFATPDFSPAPLGWFHWDFIEAFFIEKQRKIVLEAHRESAKSVLMDIFTPMHMLATGDLTGMILASDNFDKASKLTKDVEGHLRFNKRFKADFGDLNIMGSWAGGYFQTKSGIGFWSFGLGQNPAGAREGFQRPNLGIVDDADSYEKAKNPKWAKEKAEWVNGEFMGCLAKDNRHFCYGNNGLHKAGLTRHIVGDLTDDQEPDPNIRHIKVYLTEDPKTHQAIFPQGRTEAEILQSLKDQGAKAAWDEYYSLEDCAAKIVDYGITSALRQLYHKHVVTGTIFDDDNMPWVDPLPLSSYDAIVDYCDPAFGESGKGSFKAILRVGKIGHYYDVLQVWLKQLGSWWNIQYDWSQEIEKGERVPLNALVGTRLKVKIYQSWVECNELQKTEIKKTYRLANLDRKVAWYPRYDNDHKGDKIARIESLEPIFNEGLVRFSTALRKTSDMITLRDQFKGFPDGMIDGPDAFHGSRTKLDKMVKSFNTETRTGTYTRDKSKVG